MKPILVIACIIGLTAAATLVADDPESPPDDADALTMLSRELESAKASRSFVKIATDGQEWSGVPTQVSRSTVFIQTSGNHERAVVRLDRIIGVILMNSPEEREAANELLQAAHAKLVTRPAENTDPREATIATVAGTVTFNGKPLRGVLLWFVKGSSQVRLKTDDEGSYSVRFGHTDATGLYQVKMAWPQDEQAQAAIPERYQGPTSELIANVKAGVNVVNFDLTSK